MSDLMQPRTEEARVLSTGSSWEPRGARLTFWPTFALSGPLQLPSTSLPSNQPVEITGCSLFTAS